MIKLDKEQFLLLKQSDTIVVLGSGFSINNISSSEWEIISSVDSIGFNWFCHHKFGPTFYIVREQASILNRAIETEKVDNLYKELSKKSYENTCLILHSLKKHSPRSYSYIEHSSMFKQRGIIVKDTKGLLSPKYLRKDIFNYGSFHGKCSLTNVLHVILYMKYKRIFFSGIDLYNSRYFWLGKKTTRLNIINKGFLWHDKHPVFKRVLRLIRIIKKNFTTINMYCTNKKSLLHKIIPYKSISEI